MTRGLERIYGGGHLHFITTSCYWRLPHLGTPELRDFFLATLEEARQRFCFVVVGYGGKGREKGGKGDSLNCVIFKLGARRIRTCPDELAVFYRGCRITSRSAASTAAPRSAATPIVRPIFI